MSNIKTKITKAGKTVYYLTDTNGKQHQISGAKAQSILSTDEREVWGLIPNLDELNDVDQIDDEPVAPPVTEPKIQLEEQETDCIELSDTDEREVWELIPNLDEFNDETDDDELVDPPVNKPAKKARKKVSAAEQKQKWLTNAMVDETGKYYVVPELVYKNIEANKNWKPCFYIVTNDHKLTRIGLNFAIELAKAGKAIEIDKERVKELKKAA